MKTQKNLKAAVLALVLSLLIPMSAQATLRTWTGSSSNAWADANNWGGSGFPNAYTDQATIGANVNNPVSLSTTALLGGGGTALTIGTGGSGTTADLDIAGTGTLGMQGNIFITTPTSGTNKNRGITIEGTLRNDSASPGTNYSISGLTTSGHGAETVTLNGGTITTLNGGGWNFTAPATVSGYGTISAPFTGIVTATSNNQALNITSYNASPMTLTNPTLAFSSTSPNTNGYYNLSNLILNGVTLNGTSGRSQFTNLLPGTFNNNWGNTAYGLLNVTGDSTINGAITLSGGYKVFDITNSTLTLNNPGTIPTAAGNTSSPPAFVLGTGGNLTITGNNNVTFPTSAPIPINGGTLAYTGTGAFSAYAFNGFGAVSGVTNLGAGYVNANGGMLTFTAGAGGVTMGISSGAGASLNSSASSTLDLKGTYNFIQPGNISPNGGTVNLDGATLAATVSPWITNLNAGTVNVTDNSFMTNVAGASFTSSATLGINSGKTLDISGAKVNVSGGSLTNSGTLAIGAGKLNNLGSAYSLGGTGLTTLAGGSVTSTGGSGFTSTNTLRGYGTVSAPFTNSGQVRADGSGIEQTLAFTSAVNETLNTGGMGWFAQDHGKLTLPSITVNSPGTYNWGGDPAAFEMVNSLGMTFTGPVTTGDLSIALLSPDRIDVPAGLVDPIGVWAFNPDSLTFGSVSLTFRYDDALANALSLNQNNLRLWGYNGLSWAVIPTNAIDTSNKLLMTASGLPSLYQDFAVANVPEPGTVALLAMGWMVLQIKRRTF